MTIGLRRVSAMRAIGDPEFPGAIETLVSVGDGRRVVARDDMGAVMLVDVEAGAVLSKTVPGDEVEIEAVARLGDRVITTRDELLEVWDPTDFSTPLRAIPRAPARTHGLVAHADGNRVAILDDGAVEIWDVERMARVHRWEVSGDARRIDANDDELYVYADDSFEVFAWASGARRQVDLGDADCVCVHPDGRVLVGDGSAIKVCARELADDEDEDDTFSCVPPFHGTCKDIASLDAERAVSVHFGGAIMLFEVAAGRMLALAQAGANLGRVVALSPTRIAVAPSERDGSLELWEVVDVAGDTIVDGLGFSSLLASGDDQVVARTRGGGAIVFDVMTGRPLGPLPHARRAIYVDEHAVVGTNSSTIIRFDRATGDALGSIYDHALDGAHGVHAIARGGSLLGGCVYDDKHFDLIDLSARDDGWTRLAQPGGVTRVAFDGPDAAHAIVACADGAVAVWRVDDRTCVRSFACRPCHRLHAGDTWLAMRDAAGRVATFDLATGELLAELPGTYTFVGGALVTADEAGEIVRWDPRAGTRRDTWHAGHRVTAIAATRSGHVAWLDRRGELHIRH